VVVICVPEDSGWMQVFRPTVEIVIANWGIGIPAIGDRVIATTPMGDVRGTVASRTWRSGQQVVLGIKGTVGREIA
jgi:hypothetical protein